MYFVIYRVLSCKTRNLSFLLFKSTRLGRIFKKRYACRGLYAADFKIFFVKVDLVTIRYIAQIIDGLQPYKRSPRLMSNSIHSSKSLTFIVWIWYRTTLLYSNWVSCLPVYRYLVAYALVVLGSYIILNIYLIYTYTCRQFVLPKTMSFFSWRLLSQHVTVCLGKSNINKLDVSIVDSLGLTTHTHNG